MTLPGPPSVYKGSGNRQSAFRGMESGDRSFSRGESPLAAQATDLLASPASRQVFQAGKQENGSEHLQKLTIASSTEAIKGMNADLDQINQMMESNATPELFEALKEQNAEQALDFAERNPEFQRQALHDMNDDAFHQVMRVRLTGAG